MSADDVIVTEVDADVARVGLGLRDAWRYREVLYFLVWRDLKLRYRETVLGVAWAVVQPLAAMFLFTIVFQRFTRLPSAGVPYPLWSYAGLIGWVYVSNAVTQGAESVVSNASLVTKVYFPRLIIPLASALAGLVDFAVALGVVFLLMAWYGTAPALTIVVLPAIVLLAAVAATSISLWLAALNVKYRDIRHVLPFVIQFALFATPVIYPSSALHEPWRSLLALNPVAGVVEGLRFCLLGTPVSIVMMAGSVVATIAVGVTGLVYFHTVEDEFADLI